MTLRRIAKNHSPDPEIRFLTKSNFKPYDRETATPTAWELITPYVKISMFFRRKSFLLNFLESFFLKVAYESNV